MRRLGTGKLDQTVAVITGGARGIGREIAVCFAREGARCVVGDLTDMGAVSKEIKALGQDVAKLALFLASDEASFLTGQIIAVDGGRSS